MTKKILIACPAKGGLSPNWIHSLLELCASKLDGYQFDFVCEGGNHSLTLARNILALSAVIEGYDVLLTIDSDHPWRAADVVRMVQHEEPIVSALYCLKKPGPPAWLGCITPGAKIAANGLVEADFVPTGFLKIETQILRAVIGKFPEIEFEFEDEDGKMKTGWDFFPTRVWGMRTPHAVLHRIREVLARPAGPDTDRIAIADIVSLLDPENIAKYPPGRMLGEDYGNTALLRKAGFKAYIDTELVLRHTGPVDYPITPEMLGKAAPIKTSASDLALLW